ncbi:MAG TPA: hypothetical protein VK277_12020 [Acidimicrobiales bacterium]|nr:hypothetical protein [Acidimicrobiales bacterium]
MTDLPERVVALHEHLSEAGLDHAFGGALALAWCTERARGTIDIDVNVFVEVDQADQVVAALPAGVRCTADDLQILSRDGQVRLWWDEIPVDVFLDTTDFHRQAALRCRVESFAGAEVPFLSCSDLAVFKAFFNRTRDWADLEDMAAAGTLDVERIVGVLARYLGPDDERVVRLLGLAAPEEPR